MTAVLEPAVAVKPRTPAEAALLAAYETLGERALDQAAGLLEGAESSLDRQSHELSRSGRLPELKQLLETRHTLAMVHRYLSAVALGEPPEPLPKQPNVDHDLVVLYIRADANRYARLLARGESMATTADANCAKAAARRYVACQEFSSGVVPLPDFIVEYSRHLTEQAQHEKRAQRIRTAIDEARSSLRRSAEALDLPGLRSGLREAAALSSRRPDPDLEKMAATLSDLDADLTRVGLGLDGAEVEPGPITASLKAQRDDLAAEIKSRKRELAHSNGTSVTELVNAARSGDPTALASIAGTVRARRLTFRPGLSEDMVDALADALASSDPGCWADLILT